MGKRLAAVTAAVVIAGGGLTVAAINPLQVAGASDAPTTTAPAAGATVDHHGPLATALASLVKDGTLTQAQADKVAATVKADVKTIRTERRDKRQERRGEILGAVAKAIGSTADQVKEGVKGGTSIAAQAEAKGVSRQTVSDVLTKAYTDRIDAAVASGKLTADRAERAKARLPQAVTRILDADGSHAGQGNGRRGNLRSRLGG